MLNLLKKLRELLNQKMRARLYRVVGAVVPLLASYGLVTDSQAALWVALAGALFGTGLAALNTPKDPPDERG